MVAPYASILHGRLQYISESAETGQLQTRCHPPHVQVLRVCQTIYLETVDILYAKNVFILWTLDEAKEPSLYLDKLFEKALESGGHAAYDSWEDLRRNTVSRIFDDNSEELTGLVPGSSCMARLGYDDGLKAPFAFTAFLRTIGRSNASRIKALQIPIDEYFSSNLGQFFQDILQQHIPNLEQLTIGQRPLPQRFIYY